ncbi:saccharopepsin [Microdochium nivale]|nr:saccharopepsin [Microdochium nivale]
MARLRPPTAQSPLSLLLLAAGTITAAQPSALSLSASPDWFGADGDWSSVRLYVGQPQQQVDVAVSTSLCETWLVRNTACLQEQACISQRGGFYDPSTSKTWSSLGPWQLGLGDLGFGGNGDYAVEDIMATRMASRQNTTLNAHLVATINGSSPSSGFLGLGIMPQRFNVTLQKPLITQLVQRDGLTPSNSYGYTAGARYIGKGIPLSLTIGGYDRSRFEPHDVTFALNQSAPVPRVRLRSITTSVADLTQAPTIWTAATETLLPFNESVSATIDSSTPYLWLPRVAADRFASMYNLVWSESFKLYTFKDSKSAIRFKDTPNLSLTFTVSSYDNPGDLINPLKGPAVLNLNISGKAFFHYLRYPFPNMQKDAVAVPYFPLRRTSQGQGAVIGRAFLQETYLITNYDKLNFQLHQARFPDDPIADASITNIPYFEDSLYPGPSNVSTGLENTQIVGIVIGVSIFCISVAAIAIWLCKRSRKHSPAERMPTSEHKPRSGYHSQHKSGTQFWSFLASWRGSNRATRPSASRGLSGSTLHSSQQYSTKSYDRFDTPTPTIPIELTKWGVKVPENGTAYGARQYEDWTVYQPGSANMPGQHQDPTQWQYLQGEYEQAKSAQDMTPIVTYRAPDVNIPAATPPSSICPSRNQPPSNLAPVTVVAYGAANHYANIPSPMPLLQAEDKSDTDSISSDEGYDSELDRQAANAARGGGGARGSVPARSQTVNTVGAEGFEFTLPVMPSARTGMRQSTVSSLGSNFTVEEEERSEAWRALGRLGRVDDLVHIPQPAARRYSWEGEQ